MRRADEGSMPDARGRMPLRVWTAVLFGSLGLLASVVAFVMLRDRETRVLTAEFDKRAIEHRSAIQRELTRVTVVMESLSAFFSATESPDRAQFSTFAKTLLTQHPSIRALGYDQLVPLSERESFENELRAEGFPDFRIGEMDGSGGRRAAGVRDEYVAVRFIEPFEGNEIALGYDIASEPRRREALDRALLTDGLAATGPVTLIQETESQKSFLFCGPVGGSPPAGFVVGVFRIGDLVSHALSHLGHLGIELEIDDVTEPERVVRAHHHGPACVDPTAAGSGPKLESTLPLEIGGRTWSMRSWATEEFVEAHRTMTPAAVLAAGLLLTLLYVSYLWRLGSLNLRLQASDDKFQQLAENIREVFWIADPRRRGGVYVSPAYEEIWGRTCESFYEDARSFLEPIHAEDRDTVSRAMERQVRGERTAEEYRIVGPDGSVRWIRDLGFPVADASGEIRRVVGIAEDITASRREADERAQLELKVRQKQKLEGLGVLAGGIAHDFNNILTAILGHASLALSGLPARSPARSHLEQIDAASQRAAELANQMLAFSGRGRFVSEIVDVSAVIQEMKGLLASMTSGRAVVHYEAWSDVPGVEGDPGQLHQLVLNVVTNAVESLGQSGGQVWVRTGIIEIGDHFRPTTVVDDPLPKGSYVCIEVQDTGCGMDSVTLSQIFDPFFTTKFTGRGLGLAAVIGIVRAHHGGIEIDSEPGNGTIFRVLLPAASRDSETTAEPPPAEGRALCEGTALVIDDELCVREVVQMMLESLDLTVLTASGGAKGLELLRSRGAEVSIVLLDLTMPIMNGIETFERIREIDRELPVILISGYSEEELQRRYGDRGFLSFLQKPFSAEELVARLAPLLDRARS